MMPGAVMFFLLWFMGDAVYLAYASTQATEIPWYLWLVAAGGTFALIPMMLDMYRGMERCNGNVYILHSDSHGLAKGDRVTTLGSIGHDKVVEVLDVIDEHSAIIIEYKCWAARP